MGRAPARSNSLRLVSAQNAASLLRCTKHRVLWLRSLTLNRWQANNFRMAHLCVAISQLEQDLPRMLRQDPVGLTGHVYRLRKFQHRGMTPISLLQWPRSGRNAEYGDFRIEGLRPAQ